MTKKVSYETAFLRIVRRHEVPPATWRYLYRLGHFVLIYYHSLRHLSRAAGYEQSPYGIASFVVSRNSDMKQILSEIEDYGRSLGGLRGLALRYGYPPFMVFKLSEYMDQATLESVLKSLNERKRWLRLNLAVADREEALECLSNEGLKFEVSPFNNLAVKLLRDPYAGVSGISCVRRRLLVPQDVSSVLSVDAGRPYEGLLLDACSAPGLKLQYILSTSDRVIGVGVDASLKRIESERRLLVSLGGAQKAILLAGDSSTLIYAREFDKALIDAPCTGSGMIYADPSVKVRLTPESATGYSRKQYEILKSVLKAASTVVFITCSVFPEEGEKLIDRVVEEGLAEPQSIKAPFLSRAYKGFVTSNRAYRVMPHVVDGQAMFVAVLSRVRTR